LPGARSELAYGSNGVENRWWYPRSFVAPDGRVFGLTGSVMYFLDPQGDGAIEIAGEFSGENYGLTSTAVMFAPGRILQVGGGGFGANDDGLTEPVGANAASVIDINSGTPVVTAASPMRYRRHWATSTVLPDGRVLLTGGSRSNNVLQGVANVAEIWDPSTDSWTQGASGFIARLYHSTALLLPDGRVLVAGGGAPGPLTNLNAEIYHPPYLYSGEQPVSTRPIINEAPAVLDIGADFQAVVGPNDQIARVTLIKTGSVTHSFNMDQRFIELSFSQTGNGLTIAAPASRTLATPGYYMLFAIDATGTPSKGHILTVNPS
ncbi:MAG: galactose oxidase-like domain-containing protein, partial [Geminicoccaceae bacterium]